MRNSIITLIIISILSVVLLTPSPMAQDSQNFYDNLISTIGNGIIIRDDVSIIGKLGVGTTNPGGGCKAQFEVETMGSTDAKILIENDEYGSGDAMLVLYGPGFNNDATMLIDHYDDSLKFALGNIDTIQPDEVKMTITQNGRVGIGTPIPGGGCKAQFEVETMGSTDAKILIENDEYGSGDAMLVLYGPGFSNDATMLIDHNDDSLKFALGNIDTVQPHEVKMTITQDGYVGIGTINPQGILDVNGTIYQRGRQLHADYVFDGEYNLESISEHARFMWKNKHLKGIPKKNVDKEGREIVEVGAHRKGIVEELEKAHIYIEQLDSRNKVLEEMFAKLEARVNFLETELSKK